MEIVTHKYGKGLLFLAISLLGLLGLQLLPASASQGWLPTIAMLAALGLVTMALIEIVRTR